MVLKNTEGVLPSHGLRALIPSLPKIFFGDRQAEKKLSNETLAPILSSVLAPSDFGAKRELELEAGATKRQPLPETRGIFSPPLSTIRCPPPFGGRWVGQKLGRHLSNWRHS